MKSWVKFGLLWGAFMFLMINIVFPLWDKKEITATTFLIGLPIWLIAGILFGYVSRNRKKQISNNYEKMGALRIVMGNCPVFNHYDSYTTY